MVTSGPAAAQIKKIAEPEGIAPLTAVKPGEGFIEDTFAFDGSGGRLALVRADASAAAEVEVLDLGQKGQSIARFSVAGTTTWVTDLAFVTGGGQVLVVGRVKPDAETRIAAVYDLAGKAKKKLGPAADIRVVEKDGRQLVVLYNPIERKDGTTHEIEVFTVDGKRVGKKRKLVADADGFVKALDVKIIYFRAGYTEVVGLKKGNYDKNTDQRLPDNEAVYDLVDGRFAKNKPIGDLMVQARLVKLRLDHPGLPVFVHAGESGRALEVLTEDDRSLPVELALPFDRYDGKSLRQTVGRDGKIYLSLTIDPVNPAAVKAKKADPVHVDLYVVDPATGKATRLARVPENERGFVWAIAGGHLAFLRKHKGYGRGGPELEIFDLTSVGK